MSRHPSCPCAFRVDAPIPDREGGPACSRESRCGNRSHETSGPGGPDRTDLSREYEHTGRRLTDRLTSLNAPHAAGRTNAYDAPIPPRPGRDCTLRRAARGRRAEIERDEEARAGRTLHLAG